jgi:hypothetical protein
MAIDFVPASQTVILLKPLDKKLRRSRPVDRFVAVLRFGDDVGFRFSGFAFLGITPSPSLWWCR